MKHISIFFLLTLSFSSSPSLLAGPNILLITVDDMNCDSIGVFGCPLPDTTPNIDQLARESLRFQMAHVQVGNCYPSRNVMWSGRYPHNSGVEGFYQVKPIDFPILPDVMQKAGYYTAIRGKVSHSTPYQPYQWDNDLTLLPGRKSEGIKDVESYYRSTKRGIEIAAAKEKPFCININISDPHKPFWKPGDKNPASKEFSAGEIPVPGFLPEDPIIRKELALYYTSVRRADDAVGAILRALNESGKKEETLVLFLSDHGMPLPFAKTQLYHHSTWTPLIVRWPGVTKANSIDETHMVSAVDFLPTLCDIIGAEKPPGMDGRSFVELLSGGRHEGREFVFKVYNENFGGDRHPIRGVESKDYLYLFNPWSDGKNSFRTATQGTATYRRMKQMVKSDASIAARIELFDHRVVEEFYDMKADADCLYNLIDSAKHRETLEKYRKVMEDFMKASNDHALDAFLGRTDPAVLKKYIDKVSAESALRRQKKKNKRKTSRPTTRKNSP